MLTRNESTRVVFPHLGCALLEGFSLFICKTVGLPDLANWLLQYGLLAQEDAAPKPGDGGGLLVNLLSNPLPLMVGLFFLFYFIVLMPEKRRKAEEAKLLSGIKKNDRVVTIGGIHGSVVMVNQETGIVTLKVDDNTRIKINRTAIGSVLNDNKENKSKSDKDSAPTTKDT